MKNTMKILLLICILIPMMVEARINYEDAVQYTNNYIYNFEEYRDYIYLNERIPFSFEENTNKVNPDFQSGGFLSRNEYELSNAKGNSYLSNGLQYWTLTKSSYLKHYIVDYKLVEQLDENSSGVRITEFTKPDVVVSGIGTFANPWTFNKVLSIHINSDNIIRGKVSTMECSDTNMKKESIHLNVVGDKSKAFYICPESGYKFLKSTCSQYITNHNLNNMYTVDNLDRDNVICRVSYSYITKDITIKGCSSCQTAKNDRTIYVNNTHGIFLQEADGINKIETITELPTKTGYTFKGYYTSNTDYGDENKVIDSTGKLSYNEQLSTKTQIFPYMKANEYTIKYSCNGGSGSTATSSHTYDIAENLTSNGCTRKGYKFEGWSKTSSGSKEYSNTESVKNLSNIDGAEVTLYAVWTQCPAGTYGSDGLTCTKCTAGTYNSNKGSTAATACVACAAGTYSGEGASSCTNCSKGYYASSSGSTQCTICPVGTYAASTGSTSCTKCSAGTYNANTGATAATACVACAAGKYSAEGASSCTNCSKGYYASGTGNTKCTVCPTGTYASSTGSASCTKCVAGTYNPNTGSTSNVCAKCSKGYYAEGTGNKECTICPEGTYASSEGSASCTSCGSGKTSPAGSDDASDCYIKSSLPIFTYTGDYKVVKDDSAETEIATGKNNTFNGPGYNYTGNWKVKLLTDGTLTITNLGNATSGIDIFLVGGGGKGGSGADYVANSSRGGSGGGGGSVTTVKKFPAALSTAYSIDVGAAASATYWKVGSTIYFGANKGGNGCSPNWDWDSNGRPSCYGAGGTAYSHSDNRGAESITATAGSRGGKGASRETGKDGTYEFHGTSGLLYGAGGGSGGGGDSTGTGGGRDSGFNGGSNGGGKGGGGCDYCNDGGWTCCGTSSGKAGTANTGGGGGGGGGYCGSSSSSKCSNASGGGGGTGIVIWRNSR